MEIESSSIQNFNKINQNITSAPQKNEELLEKCYKIHITQNKSTIPRIHKGLLFTFIFYDNNTKLISSATDESLVIRDTKNYNLIKEFIVGHSEKIWKIDMLKNSRVASSSDDATVRIWNLNTWRYEQILTGHTDTITSLVELENNIVITGSFDQTIKLWDLKTTKSANIRSFHEVKSSQLREIWSMLLLSKGQLLVSSIEDILIYTFNSITYKDFKIKKVLKGHTRPILRIHHLEINKDLFISCGLDREIRLWSISNGICLRKYLGHMRPSISTLLISDKILVTSGGDLKFWNLYSGECINTIKLNCAGICFNSETQTLLVGGNDEDIYLIKI